MATQYKVWVEVEKVNEEYDVYEDVTPIDLATVIVFEGERGYHNAVAYARRISRGGE